MDNFLNKIKFDFQTNQKVLKLISSIDAYKGKWNSIEQAENIYLRELRKIATVESIGSSTRIEGAVLTNAEINQLLDKLNINQLKTRDEQEVIGYFETLELIFDNFRHINISENYIKQLHQNLLKYSIKDERHRGMYKSLSNKVIAKYPDGTQKVLFNPTEPHLVANAMSKLINWVNLQFKEQDIHPLITTAILIYEFLSIHPFQDGNGRLSRLITTLCLLKNDYVFIQYISFENSIEKSKKQYYKALMDGQTNRTTDKENISTWVIYFLNKINDLTIALDKKYDVYKSKGGYLNKRQKQIVTFIKKNQPVKISDIATELNQITIHTLKKDIQYMKKEKMISSIGKGKGTVYVVE